MAEWRIYASANLAVIGSDNGLSPVGRKGIIGTIAGLLSIRHKETYFNDISFGNPKFLSSKMNLTMSSAKWRPNFLALNVPIPVYMIRLHYRGCGVRASPLVMTSSNGSFFCVTGHLCGEFTGYRWIPLTKASVAELWCFLWCGSA